MNLNSISAPVYKRLVPLWPPLWFTGIYFEEVSDDFRYIRVAMAFRFYNKNEFGMQYGGNLFSMTDLCHSTSIARNLGSGYNVLDKQATIDFIKPGLSKVSAECLVTEEDLLDIRRNTDSGEKYFKKFNVEIKDISNTVIARINKTVYIRKKPNL